MSSRRERKDRMNYQSILKCGVVPVLALAVVGNSAQALEINSDESRVSLVSTKILADGTNSVSEVFMFNSVSGSVASDGAATVTIDLGTVETGIDIRNQRMGEFFFEVAQFPDATITAQIPDSALEIGSHTMDLEVGVSMHGSQMDYTVPVVISSDADNVIVVASQPVLVDATSFELNGGLQKLGELAGLLHIPKTVPVSFNLAFSR